MIYLDAAASTRPSEEVLALFQELSLKEYANPTSAHGFGREAGKMLEEYRKRLLRLFRVEKTHQALFVSGATEGNNLAIKGIAFSYQNRGKKILVSAVEHPSVLAPAEHLANDFGFELVRLPVDEYGRVLPSVLEGAMDKDVILVSIMGVNNETGAINDLAELAKVVHRFPKAYFHSDLTQAIGKMDVPFEALDLFTFSGHKIHGLKGSGALVYRSSIRFSPLLDGGGQEFGFRSSTPALPLNATLVLAAERSLSQQKASLEHALRLRKELLEHLSMDEVSLNSPSDGSPYVVNFSLKRHKASVIVEGLSREGIYVSSASACSSRTDHPSDVLLAIGKSKEDASNAIRVSFEESISLEDVVRFADTLSTLLKEVHPR